MKYLSGKFYLLQIIWQLLLLMSTPQQNAKAMTQCVVDVTRLFFQVNSSILIALPVHRTIENTTAHKMKQHLSRSKRSLQDRVRNNKCASDETLEELSHYIYTTKQEVELMSARLNGIRHLGFQLTLPVSNMSHSGIYDDILKNIIDYKKWTLTVIPIKSYKNYVSYNYDGLVIFLLANSLQTDILLLKDYMFGSLSLTRARVIVVIVGINPSAELIFDLVSDFSIFEAVVINQEDESSSPKLLTWTWDKCGELEAVKVLNTCEGIRKFEDELKVSSRPKFFKECQFVVRGKSDPPFSVAEVENVTDGIALKVLEHVASHLNFRIQNFSSAPFKRKQYVSIGIYTYRTLHPSVYLQSYYLHTSMWFLPRSENHPRWSSVTRVFRTGTWGVVIISILIVSFLNKYINFMEMSECLLETWAVFLSVPVQALPLNNSPRIVFYSWIIFSLAFTTVFQGYMTMFFIEPGKQHQIDTIEELEKSKLNVSITDNQISELHYMINRTKIISYWNNQWQMIGLNRDIENTAALTTEEVLLYSFRQLCVLNRTVLLYQLKSYQLYEAKTLNIDISSPYRPIMNNIIKRLIEGGIVEKIVQDYIDPTGLWKGVLRKTRSLDEYAALSVFPMFYCFVYYVSGICISVVFIGESIMFKFSSGLLVYILYFIRSL